MIYVIDYEDYDFFASFAKLFAYFAVKKIIRVNSSNSWQKSFHVSHFTFGLIVHFAPLRQKYSPLTYLSAILFQDNCQLNTMPS